METVKPSDREIISSHTFSTPRETLFNAVRDPAIFARWWGPAGFRNRFDVFEFRPGGAWRFTMIAPDGTQYPTVSRFDEIVPPQRIVLSHLEPGHHFRMTMTFDEAAGGGTRLTWRMQFDSPAEVERIGQFIAGANEQNFDRLAAEIAQRT
jgi:uncharacterized protein YndB with AHSA1/START domain